MTKSGFQGAKRKFELGWTKKDSTQNNRIYKFGTEYHSKYLSFNPSKLGYFFGGANMIEDFFLATFFR